MSRRPTWRSSPAGSGKRGWSSSRSGLGPARRLARDARLEAFALAEAEIYARAAESLLREAERARRRRLARARTRSGGIQTLSRKGVAR
jgi:hypothetical protein